MFRWGGDCWVVWKGGSETFYVSDLMVIWCIFYDTARLKWLYIALERFQIGFYWCCEEYNSFYLQGVSNWLNWNFRQRYPQEFLVCCSQSAYRSFFQEPSVLVYELMVGASLWKYLEVWFLSFDFPSYRLEIGPSCVRRHGIVSILWRWDLSTLGEEVR